MQRLAANELLGNLSLEGDAVGTMLGHGFHPLKAQHRGSIQTGQPVHPKGALQSGVNFASRLTVEHSGVRNKLFASVSTHQCLQLIVPAFAMLNAIEPVAGTLQQINSAPLAER